MRCPNYCGFTCVNGGCPNALADEYPEYDYETCSCEECGYCEHTHSLRLRLEAWASASRLSFPALPGDLFRDGCDHPPRRGTG